MAVTRAQEFHNWLLEEIGKLPPDTCLPPGRVLSSQWGLSAITIQRVLAKLRDEGKIVRIPGKGTFVPSREHKQAGPLDIRPDTPRESSVERMVAGFVRLISEGVYRKGEPLPAVKFIRIQFKVSSETVTMAYQRLERLGYVEKVGKSYWVGTLSDIMSRRATQEVYFLRFDGEDFRDIFNSDPVGLAFQKMERELYNAGYYLHPGNAHALSALAPSWKATGKYPAGLVFCAVNESHLPFFRSFLGEHGDGLGDRVKILVHGSHGNLSELVSRSEVFLRGNVDTEKARALARFLLDGGYREANFCIDESDLSEFVDVRFFLKIALTVGEVIPGFVFRFIIRPAEGGKGTLSFEEHLDEKYRAYLASKYPNTRLDSIVRHVQFAADPFQACSTHSGTRLWIFFRDSMAAEAIDWLRARGRSVPADVAIVGFQNDPRYYHLGITTCGPDWDNMGYVMAHAIIGDLKLARSRRGFVKVRCSLVEKLTTPR
jgi:DNA-binding transcriptional regulator YhcF (GntR family)